MGLGLTVYPCMRVIIRAAKRSWRIGLLGLLGVEGFTGSRRVEFDTARRPVLHFGQLLFQCRHGGVVGAGVAVALVLRGRRRRAGT